MRGDPADQLASALERRGLELPARILLDAHRPIGPLLANAAVFLGPLIEALVGGQGRRVRDLFAEEGGADRLLARLEDGPDGGVNAEPG